jgi:hypothetical protein
MAALVRGTRARSPAPRSGDDPDYGGVVDGTSLGLVAAQDLLRM